MEENKDLNRIKVMLAEKKRTNKWLAEQLGVNAATVSKWCTNSSQPSLDMLSKIADALNVPIARLLYDANKIEGYISVNGEISHFQSSEEASVIINGIKQKNLSLF